jgi:peptide/nickel transport system permease protein
MDSELRNYLIRRTLQIPFVLFIVSVVVFAVIHLPRGGPIELIAGRATDAIINDLRAQYHLDEPIYVQYWLWLEQLFSLSLGESIIARQPVTEMVASRLPVTVFLAFTSTVLAVLIALPAGYISAVEQYTWKDHVATVLAFIGLSIPNFFLGILLIKVFAVDLGVLPVIPDDDLFSSVSSAARLFAMPTVALGTALAAQTTRILRSSMLDVFSENYVQVARAKGLPRKVVNRSIVFKNALIPVITVVALQMGFALGATVIVEEVFALPGLGRLMVDSVIKRDFPVVQAIVMFYAVAYLLLNFTADVLYGFIDPRIRYGSDSA